MAAKGGERRGAHSWCTMCERTQALIIINWPGVK